METEQPQLQSAIQEINKMFDELFNDKAFMEAFARQVQAVIEKMFPTVACKKLCDEQEAKKVDELYSRVYEKTGDLGLAATVTSILVRLIKARNALKKGGADGLVGALEEAVGLLREVGFELDLSGLKNVYKLDENKLNEITKKLANRIDYMYKAIMKLSEDGDDEIRPEIKMTIDLSHFALDYFLFAESVNNIICEASGYQRCTSMIMTLMKETKRRDSADNGDNCCEE